MNTPLTPQRKRELLAYLDAYMVTEMRDTNYLQELFLNGTQAYNKRSDTAILQIWNFAMREHRDAPWIHDLINQKPMTHYMQLLRRSGSRAIRHAGNVPGTSFHQASATAVHILNPQHLLPNSKPQTINIEYNNAQHNAHNIPIRHEHT